MNDGDDLELKQETIAPMDSNDIKGKDRDEENVQSTKTNSSIIQSSEAGLSKRALKKLKKRQDWLDNKHERRKKEREKKKIEDGGKETRKGLRRD